MQCEHNSGVRTPAYGFERGRRWQKWPAKFGQVDNPGCSCLAAPVHLQRFGRALRSVGADDMNGVRLALDRVQRAAQQMQDRLAKQLQRVKQAMGSGCWP
jgi:hypothetical protein